MKYYIGLDAHSTTSTFAVVDSDGQCVLRETVNTSEQSLVHVINKIHGVRHLTFEESTISQWLFLQLRDKNECAISKEFHPTMAKFMKRIHVLFQ